MARVVAFVPDLLFGSSVLSSLRTAGHDVELVSEPRADDGIDVLIVDLTADAPQRIDLVRGLEHRPAKTLGFYSHVETDVKALAEQSGFDLVVPRSRMAREGAALVDRLAAPPG